MEIINCPDEYQKESFETAVFMGGGMSSTEWHEIFIDELQKYNSQIVLYNPYNANIVDTQTQINWEFKYLNQYINDYFIFSMYFDKYTKQPMSMYELGRASVLCKPSNITLETPIGTKVNATFNYGFPMVISLHPESPILDEVTSQLNILGIPYRVRTPREHAKEVYLQYKYIKATRRAV